MARRRLSYPRDPVGLASLVAAIRSYLSDGSPVSRFDREIRPLLERSKLGKQLAERLLRNFESIHKGARHRALGSLDDPKFVPEGVSGSSGPPGVPPLPGSTGLFVTPRTQLLDPNFGRTAVLNLEERPQVGVRSYTIRYVGFHCDEERGDAGWSDEVYLCTTAAHITAAGENVVTQKEKHPIGQSEYENVDAGDTRLGPVAACWQGATDVVSLTAVAFEHDYGDPKYYRDEVEAIVILAILYIVWKYKIKGQPAVVLALATEKIVDGINWLLGTEDDQTDIPRTVVLPIATLESFGRTPKKRHRHVTTNLFGEPYEWYTDLEYHFKTTHSGGGGRYVFGYEVVRDPPFPPLEPGPVD